MTSTRARSCDGKRGFPDKAAAEKHRTELAGKGTALDSITSYACRYCPQWHVGHITRRRGKKARNR